MLLSRPQAPFGGKAEFKGAKNQDPEVAEPAICRLSIHQLISVERCLCTWLIHCRRVAQRHFYEHTEFNDAPDKTHGMVIDKLHVWQIGY